MIIKNSASRRLLINSLRLVLLCCTMGEELSVTKSAQSEIPKLEQHAKITTVRPAPSVPGRELGQSFSVPINISQAITPYAPFYDSLSPEAKQQCDQLFRLINGVFCKTGGLSKES
mgnify:CR=1 FL=1|jgi:hypothetical protein